MFSNQQRHRGPIYRLVPSKKHQPDFESWWDFSIEWPEQMIENSRLHLFYRPIHYIRKYKDKQKEIEARVARRNQALPLAAATGGGAVVAPQGVYEGAAHYPSNQFPNNHQQAALNLNYVPQVVQQSYMAAAPNQMAAAVPAIGQHVEQIDQNNVVQVYQGGQVYGNGQGYHHNQAVDQFGQNGQLMYNNNGYVYPAEQNHPDGQFYYAGQLMYQQVEQVARTGQSVQQNGGQYQLQHYGQNVSMEPNNYRQLVAAPQSDLHLQVGVHQPLHGAMYNMNGVNPALQPHVNNQIVNTYYNQTDPAQAYNNSNNGNMAAYAPPHGQGGEMAVGGYRSNGHAPPNQQASVNAVPGSARAMPKNVVVPVGARAAMPIKNPAVNQGGAYAVPNNNHNHHHNNNNAGAQLVQVGAGAIAKTAAAAVPAKYGRVGQQNGVSSQNGAAIFGLEICLLLVPLNWQDILESPFDLTHFSSKFFVNFYFNKLSEALYYKYYNEQKLQSRNVNVN